MTIRCPACHGRATVPDTLHAVRKAIGSLTARDAGDPKLFDRVKALYLDLGRRPAPEAPVQPPGRRGKARPKPRAADTATPAPSPPPGPPSKPSFVCPTCSKAFATKRRLRRHADRVHPATPEAP